MMKYLRLFLLFVAVVLIAEGCRQFNKGKELPSVVRTNAFSGSIVADTIIYDVLIRNPDSLDEWTTECLRQLNHKMLIDSLFELVYSKTIPAYDFFTREKLEVSEIRKLEKVEFHREQIGKIQFTEIWYFDKSTAQLQKEVLSIVLGYELLNEEGRVRGYKPIFKLYLPH